MPNKLLIFDLDGTLVNTIEDLGHACNYALSQLQLKNHTIPEYKDLVGNGVLRLIQKALPPEKQNDPDIVEHMKEHFMHYYNQHLYDYSYPYEDIKSVLSFSQQCGYRLAVASNKYQYATERIVDHFFPSTFDIILGEREHVPRKPNIAIINDIKQNMNIYDNNCISMIGDSIVDIQTAQNAKITSVACAWGFILKKELLNAHPDVLLNTPKDLLAFLKQ